MFFALVLCILYAPYRVFPMPLNAPLLDAYDYVIVGGGTSGLTVANRLTENPNVTVLVLEAGLADQWEEIIQVPVFAGADIYTSYDWDFETVPQSYLDGEPRSIPQGKVLGGSSILNGMLWNRGGQHDYNDWESLSNPGWGWDDLLPYFIKSERFTPVSSPALQEQYSIHCDTAVHGFDGPVNVSYPSYFYNTSVNFFEGLNYLGVPTVLDPNSGNGAGATFLPQDIDPSNQTRADARRSHYQPFQDRPNLYVSTGQYVTALLYASQPCNIRSNDTARALSRVDGVQYSEGMDQPVQNITANREVILAAGALQTPKLLELSGIGSPDVLEANGIDVRISLPGVGNNLQDHALVGAFTQFNNASYKYSTQVWTNATVDALAMEEYYSSRTGPWTAGAADGNAFPSLTQISSRSAELVQNATAQQTNEYLVAGLDESIVAGFAAQHNLLVAALGNSTRPVIEILNSNAGGVTPSVMRPFSRGTVHINGTNPFTPPTIDPRYGSNPMDLQILLEALHFHAQLMQTPPMQLLLPLDWNPAMNASDSELLEFIRTALSTEYHPSCTCAMLPQELGGVVDPTLVVYGTSNLRIVDASMFPMLPASHLQAVVYAVAEKASDMIKAAATNSSLQMCQ